jgi:hypothetical protein
MGAQWRPCAAQCGEAVRHSVALRQQSKTAFAQYRRVRRPSPPRTKSSMSAVACCVEDVLLQLPVAAALLRALDTASIDAFLSLASCSRALAHRMPWSALLADVRTRLPSDSDWSDVDDRVGVSLQSMLINAHAHVRFLAATRNARSSFAALRLGHLVKDKALGNSPFLAQNSLAPSNSVVEPGAIVASNLRLRQRKLDAVVDEIGAMLCRKQESLTAPQRFKYFPRCSAAQVHELRDAIVALITSWKRPNTVMMWQASTTFNSIVTSARFIVECSGALEQAIEIELREPADFSRGSLP